MIIKQEADIIVSPVLEHELTDMTAQRTFLSTTQANKKSLMDANLTDAQNKMETNVFPEGICQKAKCNYILYMPFPCVKIAQN